MGSTRRSTGTMQGQAIALCLRSIERRREALEHLRRLMRQLEAASILEARAEQSNPTVAALLRERAAERRRIAETIRAHLDGQPRSRPAAGHCALH